MFFKTTDFSVNKISAYKLSWGIRNQKSDIRPYHALSLRVKGDAQFIHRDKITQAKTGDIVFVPAFYQYTLKCKEENIFVIHFTTKEKMPQEIKSFSPEAVSIYKSYFEKLYSVWNKKQFGYEHECKSIMYKILMHIERDSENSKDDNKDKILKAVEYMHENFTDRQLSVSFLAKCCNMSETYFRKLFFQNYSVTPLEYINKLKLKFALELLDSGYYTVSEISEKCGFANPYYFSSFIKKHTGKPPSKFITKV